MTFESWAAFTAASAVLLVIPGPTVLLVVSYALGQGWRTALPMAIGVALGDFTAMTLSMLGLGALLAASATLFTILKWVGAAYLVYLGLHALRDVVRGRPIEPGTSASPQRPFRQGLLSNLGNPKIGVFFTSLLPQFAGSFPALVALAGTFALMGLLWLSVYAVVVARAGDVLRRSGIRRALDAVTGTVLVALGVRLAAAHRG